MTTPPDFVSGQILTAAQMNSVGLWLVKSQAVTSGTSIVVTSAFSSDYDNYLVTYTGGTASTAATLSLQLGPSSVSGYNTGYYAGVVGTFYGSDSLNYVRDNNASSWGSAGGAYTDGAFLGINIFNPANASRKTLMSTTRIDIRTVGAAGTGNGFHNTAAAFTDFTLTSTATLTGGTVSVYGYRD
jgi:hypothetical protein